MIRIRNWQRIALIVLGLWRHSSAAETTQANLTGFQAGAASVDISPSFGPLIVSGGFTERTVERMEPGSLTAHAIVVRDDAIQIAIVVIDNCMIPLDVADRAKQLAADRTGIPVSRILIAATHSHSAPSLMDYCLGTRQDVRYTEFLIPRIAEAIEKAHAALQPAQVGHAVVKAPNHTANRRWIRRSDTVQNDPFGDPTVRAMMHPGHQNPEYIGPSGPVDTDLSLISFQTRSGAPIAVLANYAMHYFGGSAPADYFGLFCARLRQDISQMGRAEEATSTSDHPVPVCIMSQGTSGDIFWDDYSRPPRSTSIDQYANELAALALDAYRQIEYRSDVDLGMEEQTLQLGRRTPSPERLAWAKNVLQQMGSRRPGNQQEVYAEQAIYLHEHPMETLKLQAIRVGEVALTAIPNEVFALTGLKLKAMSPLQPCINIELANGASGYIPPPEQHGLGGYTTWPARTAGLEVQAEPKIVATLISLLEKLAGRPRQARQEAHGPYVTTMLESRPVAHWRFSEMTGPTAFDITDAHHRATLEPGIALYLNGPVEQSFSENQINRCVQLAGGRIITDLPNIASDVTISFWFWNGFPNHLRPVTGTLLTVGDGPTSDQLILAGTHDATQSGKLVFRSGTESAVSHDVVTEREWHHVFYVRSGNKIEVYLDGQLAPVIALQTQQVPQPAGHLVLGHAQQERSLEGKVDEVTVFDRALEPREIAVHFGASHHPWQLQNGGDPQPKSPAESLAVTHVPDGFAIEVMAAEPLISDPVAIDWAPDGSLWVAEMHDYPSGLDGQGKPGGRVRYLQDTDQDGKYDKSTLLAEGIPFPTGIKSWRGGAFVTAAPEILYLKDSDADGKLDVHQTVFSGFFEGNQQLRVNGLRYGLDHWLYCASGSHHGGYGAESQITATATGTVTRLGSRDFRFQPDTSRLEPQSGPSQFGRNRNDWGDWFGVQNSFPLWHYVLDDRYIRRNVHFAPPDPRHQVVVPANPKVYPARAPDKRFHSYDQAGRFTSACSGMIYRDTLLFGSSADQHGFTCEPFHNLVQHHIVTDDGVTYSSHRDTRESRWDFFASEDGWCRPVMAITGPDGALWIVDMYRYIIEHPQWLPPEGQAELASHFRRGDDLGRIYRIYPKADRPKRIPDLGTLTVAGRVALLASSNGWQRDMAQELLIQERNPQAIPLLTALARESQSPLARLHAICTLDGMESLNDSLLEMALQDPHPGVRRQAVRISESRLKPSRSLWEAIVRCTDDVDPKVRLQLANSLGQWPEMDTGQLLGRMLWRDHRDPFFAAACLGSLNAGNVVSAWQACLSERLAASQTESDPSPTQSMLLDLAAQGMLLRPDGHFRASLGEFLQPRQDPPQEDPWQDWQMVFLGNLLDRLGNLVPQRISEGNDALAQNARGISAQAEKIAFQNTASPERRAAAIRVLHLSGLERDQSVRLIELVSSHEPSLVSEAALSRLTRTDHPDIANLLLEKWKSYSPQLRSQVLTRLVRRADWLAALLSGLESGAVSASDLDLAARSQVLNATQGDQAVLAAKLLQQTTDAERAAIVREYARVRGLDGDAARGESLFRENCATCHRAKELGQAIGPNLAALTDRSVDALLGSILDPSRSVESKYQTYVVSLHDGQIKTGMVESETATSLNLVYPDGKREVILRQEIDQIQSSNKSLMPDGFDKKLSLQNVADLIQFVQTLE